jgi:lipoprotein-anchoring transpeptidase ErfK/SrfK
MSKNVAVLYALRESKDALRAGDRRAARRWAEQAVNLARDEEETWLVLAQNSSPRASVAYIEEALKINPNSLPAKAALESAQQRVNPQPNAGLEVRINASEEDGQLRTSHNRGGRRFWASVTGVLIVFAFVFVVWLSRSGSFRNAYALFPRNTDTPTTSPAGWIHPATTTRLSPATATLTPLQPATATPSPTPSPTSTFTPAPTKTSSPTPVPTDLPTLTATNASSPTSAPPAPEPGAAKSILVDISDQQVYAYERTKLVFSFVASTGRNNTTQPGHYRILDKSPNAYSDPWGFWMPYWMGIYYVGYNLENGFHSLPVLSNGAQIWGKQIGTPVTFGCVVLRPNDMKQLYKWAGIGTEVVIRK